MPYSPNYSPGYYSRGYRSRDDYDDYYYRNRRASPEMYEKPKAKHVHFGGTTFIPPENTSRHSRPKVSRRQTEREPREARPEPRRDQSYDLPRREKKAVSVKVPVRYMYTLHDGRRYELVR